MNSAASSARARSASSNTTNGLLPPSSMLNFFRPAALHDAVAGDGRAGEGDGAHVRMLAQRLADLGAVAVHDVEHAGRDAGLERELAEARRGERRQLAHLQHRGIAEGERRRDLPGRRHEGHVPWRDQRAHADRLKQRVVEVRGRRVGVSVDAHAHLGEVVEVVGRARYQLLGGLGDRLAGVLRLGAGQLRYARVRSGRRGGAAPWRVRRPAAVPRRGRRPWPPPPRRSTSAAPPRATSASTSCVAGLTLGK